MGESGSGLGIIGYDAYEFVVADLERSRRFYTAMMNVAEVARLGEIEMSADPHGVACQDNRQDEEEGEVVRRGRDLAHPLDGNRGADLRRRPPLQLRHLRHT